MAEKRPSGLLVVAGGGTRTDPTAQRRADRAVAQVAAQKARVRQLTGDLRQAQAQAARATRRAAAARRRSVQLRRALTRERRRR